MYTKRYAIYFLFDPDDIPCGFACAPGPEAAIIQYLREIKAKYLGLESFTAEEIVESDVPTWLEIMDRRIEEHEASARPGFAEIYRKRRAELEAVC